MRMNQDERRFDFHGLGAALKRAREEKGWTQAYVAELVDRDSRTIMNIENKGQY
ncbi:MAG: helix-turn-helix transcriptional regulator, partial [Clostridiaceae bacterium]|nr:helix-turn-helix transcriptional regulator [Clostridiaceae bacterium]